MEGLTLDGRPILELRGINKRFGAVHVLHDVSVAVYRGEVTALVGDNGAGKSTLIKCIGGIHVPDSGDFVVNGRQVQVRTPADAVALGIEMVYQDLAQCHNLDVVANMFLGRERRSGFVLDESTMEQLARRTLAELSFGGNTSLRQKLSALSGGQRQTVAIARVLLQRSEVVILDEPTAGLGVAQTRLVLELVRRLADTGRAVILISHNMDDVFVHTDRIIALHLGRVVADLRPGAVDQRTVVDLITAEKPPATEPGSGKDRAGGDPT